MIYLNMATFDLPDARFPWRSGSRRSIEPQGVASPGRIDGLNSP